MPIAYALAADHRDRVDRLVVSEAPLPGISPSPPLFLPPQLNERLWHLAFNQLPKVNEQLVTGREDIFFGAEFDASAGTNKLPGDAVRYYIDTLAADPDHLRGSFGFYRAIPTTIAQNEQRKARRLTLPVLAIGGAESSGEGVGNTMKLAADDVQTLVIPGCGHWVAEQAPDQLLAALTAFLAPYRDGTARNEHRAVITRSGTCESKGQRSWQNRSALTLATQASRSAVRRHTHPGRWRLCPTKLKSVPSGSTCPKKQSPAFASTSPRPAGHPGSSSPTGRRACSWRRSRSWPATGRPITTGARARRS